ncbi:MAG: glycosyltransferase family 4 protein [bacterium]
MNILIFSWRGPGHPNAGGAEIVTHEYAKAWVKAGHSVTLFTSFFPGAKAEEEIDGVRITRKGNDFVGVRLNAVRWYLGLKNKPDLVFDHFHGIPFFTPLFVGQKKVAFIHEVAKEVWWMNSLAFPFNFLYALIGYFTEPFIFRLFYRNILFVTVSESTRDDLNKWGIKKVTVIHNGIRLPKSEIRNQKSETKTAIYLGALSKDKGIEDTLRAFALINRSERDWQFWVVGRGDLYCLNNLKLKIKNLKLQGKIKFWGYVDESKKFELLARSWVMINPSVREGWGLVNIEANLMGTPVVGYDVPGIRDSVQDGKTGLLSKFGDYRSLADNALELGKNRDLYETLKKNAINWSKKFSWKKSGRESLKLIANLCQKK